MAEKRTEKKRRGFSLARSLLDRGTLAPLGALPGAAAALGITALLSLALIAANSPAPGKALGAFFAGPWSNPWFLGNTLDGIGLLLTASLGAAIAFRGGTFNLGGEGQIYLGGLAASVCLLAGGGTGPGLLFPAALAAMIAGGLMGFVPGLLKRYGGASELITSFLLAASLNPVADYLIAGPLRAGGENLLALPQFPAGRLLPRLLPPSNLNLSFVFALLLVGLGHIFINRTWGGYRFRIAGSAPAFARYGGIQGESYWIPAMTAAGALNGLAGFFAVAGTYGRCHLGFPGGLGWNAIAVALVARNQPLALFPAALVYGALRSGSDTALLASGLNFETAAFIQAAALTLATVSFRGPLFLRRPRRGAQG
jgi:simple sugar transport system permease protein